MTRRGRLSPLACASGTILLVAAIATLMFWQQTASNRRLLASERKVGALTGAVDALADALQLEQTATKARGQQPVTAPAAEVVSRAPVMGEKGERGPAGRPPTPTEIADAVVAYCTGHDNCRGPAGAAGPPGVTQAGPAGAAGVAGQSVTGPPGPGPSDEQISAAVTAYCADHGGCAGPAGPPGPSGAPGGQGPPGPTPSSFNFSYLLVNYQCADPDGDHAYTCSPI